MLRNLMDWLTGRRSRNRRPNGGTPPALLDERFRARLGGALRNGLKAVDDAIKRSG